ncbi:MAG: hypothetical protein KGL46_09905 [Hyphomicrobiales bacterium]|nr:hypothetical protein [Hyphomicrobiales bacterium]
MLRKALVVSIGTAMCATGALADVPVQDSARNTQERSIADCMTKSRVLKQQQVSPQQGIKQSMATPGASGVPVTGASDVSGAGTTAPSSGMVSGIDFSQVPMVAPGGGQGVGALNLNTVAQAVASLTAITTAIQGNKNNNAAASALMGVLGLTQLAWNQNSGARINNGLLWNQVIATSSLTAQLLNQRTLNMAAGASTGANALTFNPSLATFVGNRQTSDSNAIVIPNN